MTTHYFHKLTEYLQRHGIVECRIHSGHSALELTWCGTTMNSGLRLLNIGSVVVTAYDFESGRPGSNPELGLIYSKASITAQGLPEPSSLWGSTLGIRAAEHKGCSWAMEVD